MRVPGPSSFVLQQVASRSLLFVCAAIFLSSMAIAELGSTPDPTGPGSFSALSDISLRLPPSLLNRFPKDMVRPVVVGPRKKVDSKYDVTMIGQRGIGKGMDFYSIDREVQLGRQIANDVENSVRLVNDPVVTEYINRLGQRLVRNSDALVPFTIKVIDNDEVNAFALPVDSST